MIRPTAATLAVLLLAAQPAPEPAAAQPGDPALPGDPAALPGGAEQPGGGAEQPAETEGYRPMTRGQAVGLEERLRLTDSGQLVWEVDGRTVRAEDASAVVWVSYVATTGGHLVRDGERLLFDADEELLELPWSTDPEWQRLQQQIEERVRAGLGPVDPARLSAPVLPDAMVEVAMLNPDGTVYPPPAAPGYGRPPSTQLLVGAQAARPPAYLESPLGLAWNTAVPQVAPVYDHGAGRWRVPGVQVYRNRRLVPTVDARGQPTFALQYVGDYAFVDDVVVAEQCAWSPGPSPCPPDEAASVRWPGLPGGTPPPGPTPADAAAGPGPARPTPSPGPPPLLPGTPPPHSGTPQPLPGTPLPGTGAVDGGPTPDPRRSVAFEPRPPPPPQARRRSARPSDPRVGGIEVQPYRTIVRHPTRLSVVDVQAPATATPDRVRLLAGPIVEWQLAGPGGGRDEGSSITSQWLRSSWTEGYERGYPVRAVAWYRVRYQEWDEQTHPAWEEPVCDGRFWRDARGEGWCEGSVRTLAHAAWTEEVDVVWQEGWLSGAATTTVEVLQVKAVLVGADAEE